MMHAPRPAAARRPHHVPLLRRRLRRAGAAGRQRRRGHHRRSRSSGEFRPAVLQGLCARARRSASTAACCIRCCAAPTAATRASIGTPRSPASPTDFAASIERDGPDAVAFYLSGPVADRGLLRRQQADEGLHRLGQRRHQFAAVHGLDGRRPSPRLRRGRGARQLRRPRSRPICIVLVGSNAAWCHPVLYQRMVRNRRERGAKLVVIDPRRTATGDDADLFLPIAPGTRHRAVLRPAGASRRHRRARPKPTSRRTPRASPRRSRAPREIAPDVAATAAATGLDEGDVARFFQLFRAKPKHRHLLLAGREPVGARHRQGQRHHQLPSRHRPHRQAGHGAVLAHRPAQRHGRARGRRARQPARRAHGLRAGRYRPRAAVLERAAHGRARGAQGRADVRGDRARRDQGALGDGDQSGGVAAARRRRCARR